MKGGGGRLNYSSGRLDVKSLGVEMTEPQKGGFSNNRTLILDFIPALNKLTSHLNVLLMNILFENSTDLT